MSVNVMLRKRYTKNDEEIWYPSDAKYGMIRHCGYWGAFAPVGASLIEKESCLSQAY